MVYNWLNKLQQELFPTTCRLCLAPGLPGLELCSDCRSELPWLQHACPGCALPLPLQSGPTHCPACLKAPPALDHCQALFRYRPPVDRWIQDLKFHQDLGAARLLGRLLAETMPEPEPALRVLPVPLHRRRLRQRGYNQALEIARPLLKNGLRLETDCCRRHRASAAQSGLPSAKRRANVRGVFSVTRPLAGSRLLLVDDVMTTGATLNELARTLKNAGAEWVEAWVVARTENKNGDGY